jgi:cell wall-associated NlpC family hydrolase
MRNIESERQAVVAEARSWLRTPYHHMGRVKGGGVDCATLLAEVYARAGVAPALEIPFYPPDWHLHRNAERYLEFILGHAQEIAGLPAPGDVALWRFGKCFSHGGIVVDWPLIIHAYSGKGCVHKAAWLSRLSEGRRDRAGAHDARPVRFFTLKTWKPPSDAPLPIKVTIAPGPRHKGVS